MSPDEICACSRGALVHDGYMTGALQASRGCMLRIRRLWQRHDARRLERSILLLDEAQRCHVTAWIRIELLAFEPRLKRQLIESDLPFGSILARAGIQPSFSGRRYFALPGLFAAGGASPTASAATGTMGAATGCWTARAGCWPRCAKRCREGGAWRNA
ncbi:Uncharacterised protein [Chromobacterium violaceum]|uniref:Uncharacterized protein n=1 Tax=Chromobacterium violaceum TaxID=536 RepID=A0A3S4IJ24_CHRVL|nr:Uncharacterised protein [Chromobacterium violaceum]